MVFTPTPAILQLQRLNRFGSLDPVPEQFLLESNNGRQHGFIMDFGGWDNNAAVHEVGHGVCQLPLTLGLEHGFIEHLGWTERPLVELWGFMFRGRSQKRSSLYQPLVQPWPCQSPGSPCQTCWARRGQRQSAQAVEPQEQSPERQIPSDAQTQQWASLESPRPLGEGSTKLIKSSTYTWKKKYNAHKVVNIYVHKQTKSIERWKGLPTYKHHGGLNTLGFILLTKQNKGMEEMLRHYNFASLSEKIVTFIDYLGVTIIPTAKAVLKLFLPSILQSNL